MTHQILSNMIAGRPTAGLRSGQSIGRPQIFGNIRNKAYIHFCICYDEIDSIAPTRDGAKSTDRKVA